MSVSNSYVRSIAEQAKTASRALAVFSTDKKNEILLSIAKSLESHKLQILKENQKDIKAGTEAHLSKAMLDRLTLTEQRFQAMVQGVYDVEKLKDPVGEVLSKKVLSSGLELEKRRVPLGVIAIVYESRPNVTVDASLLCFKAGNAVVLRGGSDAIHSNKAIIKAITEGGSTAGLPQGAISFIESTERENVRELVQLEGLIDVVIPRGGESLIRAVTEVSRVPVIKHYKGVCHTFIDESADIDMSLSIIENAKCQRPGVCNAMETLLVHEGIAEKVLPRAIKLLKSKNVELRGDVAVQAIDNAVLAAKESDWGEEYLDLVLSVKVVSDVTQAISHINFYSSGHSDAIVSNHAVSIEKFLNEVDSAVVYANASTRFTDGAEFGLGAEIGISTDKLHARGPMGLEELTTYKYVVRGAGQIRS